MTHDFQFQADRLRERAQQCANQAEQIARLEARVRELDLELVHHKAAHEDRSRDCHEWSRRVEETIPMLCEAIRALGKRPPACFAPEQAPQNASADDWLAWALSMLVDGKVPEG